MLDEVSRRSFFGLVGASASSTVLPPLEIAIQEHVSLAAELQSRQGLTRSNAEAMAARARRLLGHFYAVLIGDSQGSSAEIRGASTTVRSWMLRTQFPSDLSLADAVGVANQGGAILLSAGSASLRWTSSCHFGGAVGHVLRHGRGTVFLVTAGESSISPKRVDFV